MRHARTHLGAHTQPSPRPGPSRPQRPLAAQATPSPNALWLCALAAVRPPRSRGPRRSPPLAGPPPVLRPSARRRRCDRRCGR
eukprot:966298-Prymnesium_polylepis.1